MLTPTPMWEGGNRPSLASETEARDVVAQSVHLSGWPGVQDRGDGVLIRTNQVESDPPCCGCMHRVAARINNLPTHWRFPIMILSPIIYALIWYALVRLCQTLDVQQPYTGLILLSTMIALVVVTSIFFLFLIKARANDSRIEEDTEVNHVEIVGLGATLTVVGEGVRDTSRKPRLPKNFGKEITFREHKRNLARKKIPISDCGRTFLYCFASNNSRNIIVLTSNQIE